MNQLQRSNFNFNFDLSTQEVIADASWKNPTGISCGIYTSNGTTYNLFSGSKQIVLNHGSNNDVAQTPWGSQSFYAVGVPPRYQATWTASGYTVTLRFDGEDLDGDKVLRGRGSDPGTIQGGFGNEITVWEMTVSQNGTVVW